MRKCSLILLLAMAFVLTIAAAGFCVENEIGEPCMACDGGKDAGWSYGLTIKMNHCDPTAQGTTCPCPTFDYELGSDGGGYCATQDVEGIIFKLCDCDKIDEMSTAKSYAIRLTLMEPASGVYWTDMNPANADYTTCLSDFNEGKAEDCPDAPTELSTAQIRVGSFQDPALTGGNYCLDPCDASATKRSLSYFSNTAGQTLYASADHPGDCCFTCGTNRVKSVQTCYTDLMQNLQSILLIDIPTMVYDPNDINVQLGTAVKVKVEIVEMPDNGDICAGACKIMCECLVKVGEFGDCTPQGCSLCLPYLAVDSVWWTGLALTNPTMSADTVAITIYADGQTETTTVTVDPKSVKTINVGDMLGDLPEAPMYGSITSSGAVEGFVMIGTGLDAVQGYVAPDGPCGCGSVYHGNVD